MGFSYELTILMKQTPGIITYSWAYLKKETHDVPSLTEP